MSTSLHEASPTFYSPVHEASRGVDNAVLEDIGYPAEYPDSEELWHLTPDELAQHDALVTYRGLLHTFGAMGRSENYQNFLTTAPNHVTEPVVDEAGGDKDKNLTGSFEKLTDAEITARHQVAKLLRVGDRYLSGEITFEEANQLIEDGYASYSEKFKGVENGRRRSNELKKVGRKIKKLEKSPLHA
jgi:hypothetical protein